LVVWNRRVRHAERVVDDAGFRRLSAQLGALTRGQRRRIRSALDRLDDAAKVVAEPLPMDPVVGRARGAVAPPHGGVVAVDATSRGAFGSGAGPSEVGQSGTNTIDLGFSGARRSRMHSSGGCPRGDDHSGTPASDAGRGGAEAHGAGANDDGSSSAGSSGDGPSRMHSSGGCQRGDGQSGTPASDAGRGGAGPNDVRANDARPCDACASSTGPSGERASSAPPARAPGSERCGGEGPAAGADPGFFRSKRTASHRDIGYPASRPIPAMGGLASSAARDAGARRGCQAAGGLDDGRQSRDGDSSKGSGTGAGCPRQRLEHGEQPWPSDLANAPSIPVFGRIRLPGAFQRVSDDMLLSGRPGTCSALAASLAVDKTTVWRWRRRIMGSLQAAARLPTPRSPTRSEGAGAWPAAGKRLRESRKGSRLWVDHRNNPLATPVPHRPRWVDVDRGGEPLPRPLWTFQDIVALGIDPAGRCHATVLPAGPPADDGERWRGARGDSLATSRSTRPGPAAATGLSRSRVGFPGAPADQADEPPAERLGAAFEQFLGPFRGPGAAHLGGYAAWFATRLVVATTGRRRGRSTHVATTCVSGAWASGA
jgi:hypothetical protein